MKATQTFSILIWANKAKMTDNEAPIFARVTVDGKRAEISLKKKIALVKWDVKAGYVKGNNEEARTINNYITQVKSELFKLDLVIKYRFIKFGQNKAYELSKV